MKNLHLLLLTTICLTSPIGLHAHGDKKQDAHQLSASGQDNLLKQKITLGQASYSFELIPDGISLPKKQADNAQHYHGVKFDSNGRCYVIYTTYEDKRSEATRAMARWSSDFSQVDLLGERSWAEGEIHGINLWTDGDEKKWILFANTHGSVTQTNSQGAASNKAGDFLWTQNDHPYPEAYKPTSAVGIATGGNVFVSDGYGSSRVHLRRKNSGALLGKNFASKGKGANQFRTPHGVNYDPVRKLLLFADRSNQRLVYYNLDMSPHYREEGGKKMLDQIVLKGYSPCNVRFHKDVIVVPCLNARVAFVKRNGEIVSTLKMPKDYIEAGLDGIHDADISPDGESLVIGVWQRKGRPSGTLTRWKRIR
ncbi:MAG: hypothetical protein QM496_00185 [Verrucomicrobiota bacterium]